MQKTDDNLKIRQAFRCIDCLEGKLVCFYPWLGAYQRSINTNNMKNVEMNGSGAFKVAICILCESGYNEED